MSVQATTRSAFNRTTVTAKSGEIYFRREDVEGNLAFGDKTIAFFSWKDQEAVEKHLGKVVRATYDLNDKSLIKTIVFDKDGEEKTVFVAKGQRLSEMDNPMVTVSPAYNTESGEEFVSYNLSNASIGVMTGDELKSLFA